MGFLQIFLGSFLIVAVNCITFNIQNNAGGPIWIGTQGNTGLEAPNNGGFILEEGQSQTVTTADNWVGRFWARTYCDYGTNHCLTGDCGDKIECGGNGGVPPATLVEINNQGDNGNNFYDISLVDGFNVPASISPQDGQGDCKSLACTADINANCPEANKVYNGDTVIACKSACEALDTDIDCCRGEYGPDNCPHSSTATYFKEQCPDAYSFAYDDPTSLVTCQASTYDITFG